jgi:WD40 repeat protein/tRNA A-37 threonylcarbamoyl transferase component Bud32
MTPSAETEPGTVIGYYKLLEKIGEGGFGVVYVAEQKEPIKRRVALKIIKLGMDTKQVVARFEAERQALALMDHANIAKVLDAGATETGRPYFVMELVRGIPLTQYCDEKVLHTHPRLDLFIKICQAVQHAHQKGIIHRDLKPSNILVTLHDGVPVPKVIDFGIAKATQGALTDKTVYTQFQQFIGTPAYMSPEQAEMSGLDIDTRSDIYSLGVLLYELLTGKTPFDSQELLASGLDEMRRRIREEEPVRPSTRLSGMIGEESTTTAKRRGANMPKLIHLLRGDLDWIVMKCLEKDRARRYETANAVAMDLQRHLNNEPVVARPPSAAYRFQKAARRHKVVFASMAAIASTLLLGIIMSTVEAFRAKRAERAAEVQKQSAQRAERLATEQSKLAIAQSQRADASAFEARQNLYEEDMLLAYHASDEGNLGLALKLLNKHRPAPGQPELRGWEWRYLWGLCQSDELSVFATNGSWVMCVAMSPDGTRLSTAESGKAGAALKLWEYPSGRLLAIPETKDAAGSVAFSADGKQLAFTTRHHGVVLWDIAAGEQVTNFPGILGNGWQSVVQFSPDGRTLVASRDQTNVVIWDVPTKTEKTALKAHSDFVSSLAFSPDGKILATGSFDKTIRLWSVAHWKQVGSPLTGHTDSLQCLTFSPDGKTLASAGWDATVRIWDVAAQREIKRLTNHSHVATAVAFSPDQKVLASSGADFTIRLWDTKSWKEVSTLRGNLDEVWSIAFSADGATLVSGGKDGIIRTWSAVPRVHKSERLERPLDASDWGIRGGVLFCAQTNGTIRCWDAATLRQMAQYSWPEEDRTNSIRRDFGPSGKLVWANHQNEVVVWDLNAARQVVRFPWVPGSSKSLRLSPDETLLVGVAAEAGRLTVWDLGLLKEVASFPKSEPSDPAIADSVNAVEFSREGNRVALGNWDGTVEVWDLDRKERIANWAAHQEPVSDLGFLPGEEKLVTVSADATAKVWEVESGKEVKAFARALNDFQALAVAPGGERIAGETSRPHINVWNPATGQEVAELSMDRATELENVHGFQFLPPDGSVLAICSDSFARVWRAPSWEEIKKAEAKRRSEAQAP